MNRNIYLFMLVLVSGSLLVQSRSIDPVNDNPDDHEQQLALIDKRISNDRIDDTDLVEGLQLAGFG